MPKSTFADIIDSSKSLTQHWLHCCFAAILCCPAMALTCSVAVHLQCYGLEDVPQGKWLCDGCKDGLPPDECNCAMCPVVGGGLKQVLLNLLKVLFHVSQCGAMDQVIFWELSGHTGHHLDTFANTLGGVNFLPICRLQVLVHCTCIAFTDLFCLRCSCLWAPGGVFGQCGGATEKAA